jgi:hypothetical protein
MVISWAASEGKPRFFRASCYGLRVVTAGKYGSASRSVCCIHPYCLIRL